MRTATGFGYTAVLSSESWSYKDCSSSPSIHDPALEALTRCWKPKSGDAMDDLLAQLKTANPGVPEEVLWQFLQRRLRGDIHDRDRS